MDPLSRCLCWSDRLFGQCCGPYLTGAAVPPTAEALMRSRFAAFRLRDAEYVRATWDSAYCPQELSFDLDERDWFSLEIVGTLAGGESDERGVVEFKAKYELGDETYLLHEVGRFSRQAGRWVYRDGSFPFHGRIVRQAHYPRNAPCSCGSGKQYRKCCGG